MQSAALFLKMGKWLWHFPQPRFLPRLGLWECPCRAWLLSQQTPHFPRVHFCLLSPIELSNVCRDKMSEGLLWLGTLSIQTGTSKSLSTWKMRLINLSLSSLADQLLRKAPRTASLSVDKTTRQVLIISFHPLTAASTAIISKSWMTVFWPFDIISSKVAVSTLTLKNDLLTCHRGHCNLSSRKRHQHLYMHNFGLWRFNFPGNVLNQQITNVMKTRQCVRRQRFSASCHMVRQNFQQPPEFPSKNLWAGELRPSSELLTLTPGKHVRADSFIQFTNEFLHSLSSVLVTKHSLSPDRFKSSWTPKTLQSVLRRVSQRKTQHLDSLFLAKQRKSSKYTDHIKWRRVDPTFQSARDTRRKAVTDAMDPKGKTHCLNIFADEHSGSYTAKYESRWKSSSERGSCL